MDGEVVEGGAGCVFCGWEVGLQGYFLCVKGEGVRACDYELSCFTGKGCEEGGVRWVMAGRSKVLQGCTGSNK